MANFRAEFCEISKAIGLKSVHLRFYSGFGEIRKVKYLSDFRNTTQIKPITELNFRNPLSTALHANVVWYILVTLAEIFHYVLKITRLAAREPN